MNGCRISRLGLVLAALTLSPLVGFGPAAADEPAPAGQPTTQATTQPADDTEELRKLVTQYFAATSSRDRSSLLKQATRHPAATLERVAEAIRSADLWPPREAGVDEFSIDTPRRFSRRPHTTRVSVRVPEGYDPQRGYPLILAFHAEGGDGAQMVRLITQLLHEQVDEFLIVGPTDYEGVWLGSSEDAAGDPTALLDALVRRYHVDRDRVYVTGYSLGGHAAFLLAALHPDQFAAAMPLAGTLALQLGGEAVDLFLPNLQNTPVTVVYGALDSPSADVADDPTSAEPTSEGDEEATDAVGGIAEWNRYIAARAAVLNVPIRLIEVPGAGHDGIVPEPGDWVEFLSRRRVSGAKSVQLWFRYPCQGRTSWLRQTRFAGDPWDAQQVIVSPASHETAAQAVTDLLQERLALVAGRIEGQTIRIATNRCDQVELLLSDELIDLDQDIEIVVDGSRRFAGRAERSAATMLEVAAGDWDLARLWPVRFRISSKGRAIPF